MRAAYSYPLVILCLSLFGSSDARAQGFGGTDDDCRIIIDGRERSCAESASETGRPTKIRDKTPASSSVEKRPKESSLQDRKVRPKAVPRPESGWRFTEDPNAEEVVDVLAEFTNTLEERRAELDALEDRAIYKREERERVETLRALIDREQKVAVALGDRAKGMMLACAQAKHPKWFKRYGVATGIKMTPGGPVAAAPEVGADPSGCERSRFVSQALLTGALRYFELEHILKTRRWEYGQGDERRRLEAEYAGLKADLHLENTLEVRVYNKAAADALYLKGDADALYLKNQKRNR